MPQWIKDFWFAIALCIVAFILSLGLPAKAHGAVGLKAPPKQIGYIYDDPQGRGHIAITERMCPSVIAAQTKGTGWQFGIEWHTAENVALKLCWRQVGDRLEVQYENGDDGYLPWSEFRPLYDR